MLDFYLQTYLIEHPRPEGDFLFLAVGLKVELSGENCKSLHLSHGHQPISRSCIDHPSEVTRDDRLNADILISTAEDLLNGSHFCRKELVSALHTLLALRLFAGLVCFLHTRGLPSCFSPRSRPSSAQSAIAHSTLAAGYRRPVVFFSRLHV